jgi:hypothetical protein
MRRGILTPMLLLFIILAVPARARAALGADAASVARDREALKGALTVTATAAYEIHEMKVSTGVVREYLAPGGLVFAVTWQDRRAPDLRQLLGAWFDRYTREARAHRTGHHVLSIDTPDFAVSTVRFQRGFQGRVILPGLMPAGVNRDELR